MILDIWKHWDVVLQGNSKICMRHIDLCDLSRWCRNKLENVQHKKSVIYGHGRQVLESQVQDGPRQGRAFSAKRSVGHFQVGSVPSAISKKCEITMKGMYLLLEASRETQIRKSNQELSVTFLISLECTSNSECSELQSPN